MKKKLLIFDLDGTLVDSLFDVSICFNQALNFYGFHSVPFEDYGKIVGGDLEQVVFKLLPPDSRTDKNITNVKELYKKLYAESDKENTTPYEGIVSLLEKSKTIFKLAVHSNKNHYLTEQVVGKLFGNLFDCVLGSGYGIDSKPSSAGVQYLAEKSNVDLNSVVYVGDTATDVMTAKNANIDCLYVKWGQGKPYDLALYEKAVAIESVEALGAYLEKRYA